MPFEAYPEWEVEKAIRLAYATGVRDVLISIQGGPLTEEQAKMLTEFVTRHKALAQTVGVLKGLTASVTREESRISLGH